MSDKWEGVLWSSAKFKKMTKIGWKIDHKEHSPAHTDVFTQKQKTVSYIVILDMIHLQRQLHQIFKPMKKILHFLLNYRFELHTPEKKLNRE